MQVVVDDDQYATVAEAYLRKFVPGVVRALANTGLITFDPNNITEKDISLVYGVCFLIFANIEDEGGFISDSQRYVAHLAFAEMPRDPASLLMSWKRTDLHGRLDDDIIIEAITLAAT